MSVLILVRHANVTPKPELPASRWPVNAEGQRRSAALVNAVRGFDVRQIITSSEVKARQTGQIIADGLQIPLESRADFDETRNTTFISDQQVFKQQVQAAMRQPDQLIFGVETFAAARQRFIQHMMELIETYPDKSLMIVSHGRILSMVLAHLTGRDPVTIWSALKMPDYIVLDRPDLTIQRWGDEQSNGA